MPLDSNALAALRQRIRSRVRALSTDLSQTTKRMLAGDHWLDTKGWVGPMPDPSEEFYSEVMAMIKRVFASQNKIKEVAERHRDSVIGDEPDWGFTPKRSIPPTATGEPGEPSPEEKALIQEAENALTVWWDAKGALGELQVAVRDMVARQRGVISLYIPARAIETTDQGESIVPRGSLSESLARIYVKAQDPDAAGWLPDEDGVNEGAYRMFVRDKTNRLEWQYVDAEGNTVVMVEQGKDRFAEASYPLGGTLLIFEMTREALITEQVISQQKIINKFHTAANSRNLDTAGFLTDTILNGQMPGQWADDPNNPGKKIFMPDKEAAVGAGVRNYVSPYILEADQTLDGKTLAVPASIDHREPIDIARLKPSLEIAECAILKEVSQLHVELSGDANASGKSREQATNEYRNSLKPTRIQVEAALRWLLGTALKLAAHFEGDATRFDALRPYASVNLNVTAPTAEDVRVDLEMADSGRMSDETLMMRSGRVSDVAAEKRRLQQEALERRKLGDPNKRRDSIAAAVQAGLYSQRQGLLEEGKEEAEADRIVQEKLAEDANAGAGVVGQGGSGKMQESQNINPATLPPGFVIGAKIRVKPGRGHGEMIGEGTIAEINGTALGILFDDMPEMGIHRWYVADELELVNTNLNSSAPRMQMNM